MQSRTSWRAYRPWFPEKVHGTPRRLSARRNGSASALARTRIAKSRYARRPALHALLDRRRHGVRLLGDGLVDGVHGLRSGPPGRDEPLVDPARGLEAIRVVVADQPVGRVEQALPRAVVLDEHHAPGVGVGRVEPEDVAHGRAAEPEDRLVVVPHDGHVPVPAREELHQLELGVVRVLELVDQDVPEPPLVVGEDVRPLPEEAEREEDLVAEVDEALAHHQVPVRGVGARQLERAGCEIAPLRVLRMGGGLGRERGRVGQVGLGRHVLVLGAPEEARQRLEVPRRVAERPEVVERQLEQARPEEQHLLGPVQDPEGRRQSELEGVLPEEPVAERVEGRDADVGVAVRDEDVDALLHLERGLVGEREREDLLRPRPARGDEVGDAAREDGGLAGPGPGDDQERPLVVGDRLALGLVQVVQDPWAAGSDGALMPGKWPGRSRGPRRPAARRTMPSRPPGRMSPAPGEGRRRRSGVSVRLGGSAPPDGARRGSARPAGRAVVEAPDNGALHPARRVSRQSPLVESARQGGDHLGHGQIGHEEVDPPLHSPG